MQHTPAIMRPPTYTAEGFWVWVQSEKMHLTLKRLEAPGNLEVWWGGGMGASTWRQDQVGMRCGMWNRQRVDSGGREWNMKCKK